MCWPVHNPYETIARTRWRFRADRQGRSLALEQLSKAYRNEHEQEQEDDDQVEVVEVVRCIDQEQIREADKVRGGSELVQQSDRYHDSS